MGALTAILDIVSVLSLVTLGFLLGLIWSGRTIKKLSYEIVDHIETRCKEYEQLEQSNSNNQ